MNNKIIASNRFSSTVRKIYDALVSIFNYNPAVTIKDQIRKRYPDLQEQEVDRLTEAEVQRFYTEYYPHLHIPPM